MKKIVAVIGVLVAIFAYDFMQVPVPPGCKDVLKTRFFLYLSKRMTYTPMYFRKLAFGQDQAYLTWVQNNRVPYIRKDDREEDGLKIVDRVFNNVPVRIYDPLHRVKPGPAVFFIHGGGWVMGSVEVQDSYCRDMSRALNMLVVSVEYRLAPENTFPVPFRDCLNAATYFFDNAETFGVDASRIAIGGDSSGGNLAAAVTLKIRDLYIQPQPKLQVLIYPNLQCLDFKHPSSIEQVGNPIVREDILPLLCLLYARGSTEYVEQLMENKHTTKEVKSQYRSIFNYDIITGKEDSTPEPTEGKAALWEELEDVFLDPYFAPLLAEDLKDLPKTLVTSVEHDPLKDEAKLFVARLKEAEVDVELYHNMGGFHALNSMGRAMFDTVDARESNAVIWNFIDENI